MDKYTMRLLLAPERLFFEEKDGEEEERMDYEEFHAKVSSDIPEKGRVMTRYQ